MAFYGDDRDRSRRLSLLPVLLAIGVWQVASTMLGEAILPGALEVLRVFVSHAVRDPVIQSQGGGQGGFLPHVAATAVRVVVGVAAGSACGVALAVLFFSMSRTRQALEPALEALRVVPPLILIPFVLILFGPTELAQFAVCGLYAGFSMFVHSLGALEHVQSEFWTIAHVYRASWWQTMRTVAWPGALPEILGGLRISAGVAVGIVVVGEYMGAANGIGRVLKFSISLARTDLVLVGICWASLVGVALDLGINRVVGARLRWLG